MFDWVPIQQYTFYFNILVLLLVLFAALQCFTNQVLQKSTVQANAICGVVVTILIILYMGLRPVHHIFGDTVIYARSFDRLTDNEFIFGFTNEWAFHDLMIIHKRLGDLHSFFVNCAIIYVGSLWWAMKRIFGNYYWIPLLVAFSMFTFWDYGVNGIRNGMGASVFILAISFANQIPIMILLAFLATGFHTSIWLMVAAAIAGWLYQNSKSYLVIWILCVVLSWFWGGTIQDYLGNLSLFGGDDRFTGYLNYTQEQMIRDGYVVDTSFRWDFLIYSSFAVGVGYYFIFERKFKDEYYHWLYNVYLITNAFWILIIRAPYSNRFAQISWFIMPIVLIYPFMKKRFWKDHERMIGYAIVAFYAYTFYVAFIH